MGHSRALANGHRVAQNPAYADPQENKEYGARQLGRLFSEARHAAAPTHATPVLVW
jgi:hypothetical protein